MINRTVLERIPFKADMAQLRKALHISDKGDEVILRELVAQAEAIARPKAVYRVVYIDHKDDEGVVLDGIAFTSRVLRVNLDTASRVFAYVATAGVELEQWANSVTDIVEQYWADGIMLQAVRGAMAVLTAHLKDVYAPAALSRMNPGSLADWPLREQAPLFRLVGDVTQAIGVQLTDSYLMVPRKSVSGIQFPTAESFESCQLCPREGCPGRRAPYDADLFERKYSQAQA